MVKSSSACGRGVVDKNKPVKVVGVRVQTHRPWPDIHRQGRTFDVGVLRSERADVQDHVSGAAFEAIN